MENIILTGYMGSGKTTVGKSIALLTSYAFVDTDEMIVEQQRRSINEIFATDGELAFRDMETELLRQLVAGQSGQLVIATGGGMPVKAENRQLLSRLGKVVYLKADPETIYDRIRTDTTRPLLQCENPMGRIGEMLAVREPLYEEGASAVVDVSGLTPSEAADAVIRQCRQCGKDKQKMKLLVINGPNLNFLGIREKGIYGTQDYKALVDLIQKKAKESDCEIECFQSNHEGAIIDRIQESYFDGTEGIIINPGAYTHYSYAIRDALASIRVPKVEIHISDITRREEFRRISVTKEVCDHQIYGHGLDGYLMAVDYILAL